MRETTETPVASEIARAKGRDGIVTPCLILLIIERSQLTDSANAASVIPLSCMYWPSSVMGSNVHDMNVNVNHHVNDIVSTAS